jgi:enoyl-CoA hydratase
MTDTAPVLDEPEVLFEERGAAGIVTLNRPKALNALTHGMVRLIATRLDEWEGNAAITRIVLRGAGERAFCAGGDIRSLHDAIKAGETAGARAFWREEYQLNIRLKRYPKPIVAILDGIVMGGGVGLSFHGSHRVATEKLMFAMPEVGIGFFPDVGATWLLPRLPGFTGDWLALTGSRIGAGDALALGLATGMAASADVPALIGTLADGSLAVDDALSRHAAPVPEAPVRANRAMIDHAFGGGSVGDTLARLDAAAARSAFAREAAAQMRTKCPFSQGVAREQMRLGPRLTFEQAMAVEYRIVCRVGLSANFLEGVRAVIVDRDNRPSWSPARLEEVDPAAVAACFAPLPDDLPL